MPLRCLYFTYDGLLDPLGRTQVLPYIYCLAQFGHSFTIISFEKPDREESEFDALEKTLASLDIVWLPLKFRFSKFGPVLRLIQGVLAIRKEARTKSYDIAHLRGFHAAVIYRLSRVRIPYIYDFRGFALQEYAEIGKMNSSSILFRLFDRIDQACVLDSMGMVVLEESAKTLLESHYSIENKPVKVIRTSTDTSRYQLPSKQHLTTTRALTFVSLGGARYPYRPDLMFQFMKKLQANDIVASLVFINERDHDDINRAAEMEGVHADSYRILSVESAVVPQALHDFDFGLIFIDSSKWRRVCSPTKLGEYLAAGLPVIASPGIDVIDHYAERTRCVHLYDNGHFSDPSVLDVTNAESFIGIATDTKIDCNQLANNEFSLAQAGSEYGKLYNELSVLLEK